MTKGIINSINSPRSWWKALPVAFLAIIPFLALRHQFAQLFWFGDEWDLLDQIDRFGLWSWSWQLFAENFVPLFKLMWAGAVALGSGSYLFMLGCLWATHALNTYLLGRLLQQTGMGWLAVITAQVLFALPPNNWETLAWSVQWSAMLSNSFLLLGGLAIALRLKANPISQTKLGLIFTILCVTASAWTFSRGVLTGIVLGTAWLLAGWSHFSSRRCITAGALAAPAVLTALLITLGATGNHQHISGHLDDAAAYAAGYFILNPFHALLGMDSWGLYTSILLAVLKLSLVGWGLWYARNGVRLFLLMAIAFDLGNAVLLGVGRYHTGIETTISSRYQYSSLLAITPFLGFGLESLISRCRLPRLRSALSVGIITLSLLLSIRGWPAQLNTIIVPRGKALRETLAHYPNSTHFELGGIPSMSMKRARELAEENNLH